MHELVLGDTLVPTDMLRERIQLKPKLFCGNQTASGRSFRHSIAGNKILELHMNTGRISHTEAYGFAWVTGVLFITSLVGHWLFGWFAYIDEQRAHSQPPSGASYVIEMGRDTLENWQSEFLQLLWQVDGLAYLFYIGSLQSKESDHRKEEKLDEILRRLDPEGAKASIDGLDRKYPRVR
jgi:hypothetical protein